MLVLVALLVNALLTPGMVRPLTREQICSTHWGLDARHVTSGMKMKVFEAYGIPLGERKFYIIDHLIPRELGGADDLRNLWPQRIAAAHVKDRVENALHKAVCAVYPMPLEEAQQQMRQWAQE